MLNHVAVGREELVAILLASIAMISQYAKWR